MANFRTRARAVDLLGKQQIRDEVTALSELLRNSYDADADEGLVMIDTRIGRVLIWDDGDGMTEEDIQQHWLTLGTYSKRGKGKTITRKGRVKIGEKGIGRLAISLLGDQLLLISKRRATGQWALLYLHWDLFRNEKLFLEDIEIPTRKFSSLIEIQEFLSNDLDLLKKVLLKNLNDKNVWTDRDRYKIEKDLESFTLDEELFKRLRTTEKRGAGTSFYITHLDNELDWHVYEALGDVSNVLDERMKQKRLRMRELLFAFANFIDFLEKDDDNYIKSNMDFTPKIHINGAVLEKETFLNREELNMYDYALKGIIEDGYFTGTAHIKTEVGEDITTLERIPLTHGLYKGSYNDCGPVKLKWFFVEGDTSILPKDQHELITSKLDRTGGIFVYRDGLRILPYGEAGNDFLEIERRRTLRAGTWLFSHRRMFGYISITKEQNPDLLDKSSREGFVENHSFNYFQAVASNLLKWWAVDFLQTRQKNGRRGSRNSRIEETRSEKKRLEDAIKREQIEEREYFKKLTAKVAGFQKNLKVAENNIHCQILDLIDSTDVYSIGLLGDFSSILRGLQDKAFGIIAENFEPLTLTINQRYVHSLEYTDAIETANYKIEELTLKLQKETNNLLQILELKYKSMFPEEEILSAVRKKEVLLVKLQSVWRDYNNQVNAFENEKRDLKNSLTNRLNKKLQDIEQDIALLFNKVLEDKKKESIIDPLIDEAMEEAVSELLSVGNKKVLPKDELRTWISKAENTIQLINSKIEINQKSTLELRQKMTSAEELKNVETLLDRVEESIEKIENNQWLNDDNYIGFLKKEVALYRDLSAVGLAAELTSHEFNALHFDISQNLSTLSVSLRNTKAKPVVDTLSNAFQALERLHQRMSPLYRQVRMRRTDINLKQFLINTLDFFSADIYRYKVKIVIDIPENIRLKEAEPIIFTPVINITANAIYWLLNREDRQIHFYLSNDFKRLYIHDTGPGISDKDIDRIFEPFFSRRPSGRGLGLFLSKDILQSRGHNIGILSSNQKLRNLSGACFFIEFKESCFFEEEFAHE
ncbi:ATP-binding protein [Anaerospora sp.]|uniref:ATP-binding protein n=1 Tax=Anaerospora sp. TaxID=1960278 RepID=UPI00289DF3F3|nr:ATP-binding protein [Anaerospora sp.]